MVTNTSKLATSAHKSVTAGGRKLCFCRCRCDHWHSPGQRDLCPGGIRGLDDPTALAVASVRHLMQHLNHLTTQGVVWVDHLHIPHRLRLFRGFVFCLSRSGIRIRVGIDVKSLN